MQSVIFSHHQKMWKLANGQVNYDPVVNHTWQVDWLNKKVNLNWQYTNVGEFFPDKISSDAICSVDYSFYTQRIAERIKVTTIFDISFSLFSFLLRPTARPLFHSFLRDDMACHWWKAPAAGPSLYVERSHSTNHLSRSQKGPPLTI